MWLPRYCTGAPCAGSRSGASSSQLWRTPGSTHVGGKQRKGTCRNFSGCLSVQGRALKLPERQPSLPQATRQLDVMLTESDVLIETHRAEGQSKDLINSYTLYVPKEHVFKSLLQSPESSQILPSVSLFICNISVTMVIITN